MQSIRCYVRSAVLDYVVWRRSISPQFRTKLFSANRILYSCYSMSLPFVFTIHFVPRGNRIENIPQMFTVRICETDVIHLSIPSGNDDTESNLKDSPVGQVQFLFIVLSRFRRFRIQSTFALHRVDVVNAHEVFNAILFKAIYLVCQTFIRRAPNLLSAFSLALCMVIRLQHSYSEHWIDWLAGCNTSSKLIA